jgi:hypothetical protein
VVDQVQFPGGGDLKNLAGEFALKCTHLGDDTALRQSPEKSRSLRHDGAITYVLFPQLGRRPQEAVLPQ